MQSCRSSKEAASTSFATVLPTDTLLCALRVMDQHCLTLLPVMASTGGLLGLISERHILAAWTRGPLALVAEVMTVHRVTPYPARPRPLPFWRKRPPARRALGRGG